MTRNIGTLPCAGDVAGSIIKFVQIHSEKVHADVVTSSMNIICKLCSGWEPNDQHAHEWVESLAQLLNHANHDLVVKKALKALLSIFECFISCGRELNSIVTDGLITTLSRHLFVANGSSAYIEKASIPFFCGPPLLELARLLSIDEADNQGECES